MTKDEFTAHLKDKGMDATLENGCVIVRASAVTKTFAAIRKEAKACGYNASYGCRKEGNETG